ncbi:hypothetical protein EC845_1650 [Comamonas sp. BIGb0124]|uniref:hypothetical protein n=1 Tax=Comamonas sp. BIGb0124 TaxID=2485130 RepID=UPI000F4A3588|nr:hypothetical protein [Comamonas sp. BIGb0124]ROR22747.1 hypothetical protein EC845_1650 [Comamonas sp. BIGb0124]
MARSASSIRQGRPGSSGLARAAIAASSGMLVLTAVLLTGCSRHEEASAAPGGTSSAPPASAGSDGSAVSSASAPAALPAGWLGRWQGPEGTFLELDGEPGRYEVVIQNLDGPRTFAAQPEGDAVRFVRDGQAERLRAGDGQATGMKWLADKKNCLVVKAGEGYCRD